MPHCRDQVARSSRRARCPGGECAGGCLVPRMMRDMARQHRRQHSGADKMAAAFALDQHFLDKAHPRAAGAFGQADAEPAERGHGLPGSFVIGGPSIGAQPLDRQLAVKELADGPRDHGFVFTEEKVIHRAVSYRDRGRPSSRSPMVLRWISEVPPAIVAESDFSHSWCQPIAGPPCRARPDTPAISTASR